MDGVVDDENRERGPHGACFEESRVGEPDKWRHMKHLFWMLLECKSPQTTEHIEYTKHGQNCPKENEMGHPSDKGLNYL